MENGHQSRLPLCHEYFFTASRRERRPQWKPNYGRLIRHEEIWGMRSDARALLGSDMEVESDHDPSIMVKDRPYVRSNETLDG